jgi:hypothetical protein
VFVVSFASYRQYKLVVQNNIETSPSDNALIQSPQVNSIDEIEIDVNGWEIPDLAKCKINKTFQNVLTQPEIPQKIYITHYTPREINLLYSAKGDKKFRIRDVYKYKIENRTFCYRVLLSYPIPTAKGCKNCSGVAVTWNLSIYDIDGDGKFETLHKKDFIGKHLLLPKWVKN